MRHTATEFRCEVCHQLVTRIGIHVEDNGWRHEADGGHWVWTLVRYGDEPGLSLEKRGKVWFRPEEVIL